MNTFKSILIYEDSVARSRRFLPLCYNRPVAALRSGAFTGIERVKTLFPDEQIFLHTSPALVDVSKERYGVQVNQVPEGATLMLSARAVVSGDLRGEVVDSVPQGVREMILAGAPLPAKDSKDVTALWDIIHQNPQCILADLEAVRAKFKSVDPASLRNCYVEKPQELIVHPNAKIGAGVVLDCSEGPIIIEEGARIMPHATIVGPCVIGKGSLVKVGAKIYGGTSIGPVCKVGGEIENSIIQGYANKQHDGYLGHSYLGEWVNLGADTNTSDLKNDYSTVRVTIEGEEFDTQSMFVGLLMGDHSKSAINSQFNTGTAVGVSSNIFDAGFPPKWIPSFSWGGASALTKYRFDKALQVAKIVTSRRGITLTPAEEALLKSLAA